jgi:hypothetical protein
MTKKKDNSKKPGVTYGLNVQFGPWVYVDMNQIHCPRLEYIVDSGIGLTNFIPPVGDYEFAYWIHIKLETDSHALWSHQK